MSNWQQVSSGTGNGLAPNKQQAITWANENAVYWCRYVSPSLNKLTKLTATIYQKPSGANHNFFDKIYSQYQHKYLFCISYAVP